MILIAALRWALLAELVSGDVVFPDFNITTGLVFNADAATSNCGPNIYHAYGDVQGKNDQFNLGNFSVEYSENNDLINELTIVTNEASTDEVVNQDLASFLNRNDTLPSPTNCSVRIRLTPSGTL